MLLIVKENLLPNAGIDDQGKLAIQCCHGEVIQPSEAYKYGALWFMCASTKHRFPIDWGSVEMRGPFMAHCPDHSWPEHKWVDSRISDLGYPSVREIVESEDDIVPQVFCATKITTIWRGVAQNEGNNEIERDCLDTGQLPIETESVAVSSSNSMAGRHKFSNAFAQPGRQSAHRWTMGYEGETQVHRGPLNAHQYAWPDVLVPGKRLHACLETFSTFPERLDMAVTVVSAKRRGGP